MSNVRVLRGYALRDLLSNANFTHQDFIDSLRSYGFQYDISTVAKWLAGTNGLPVDNPQFNEAMIKIFKLHPLEFLRQFVILPHDLVIIDEKQTEKERELLTALRSGKLMKVLQSLVKEEGKP